ncbi:MAG: hypothetical protein V4510_10430 [bacterium]
MRYAIVYALLLLAAAVPTATADTGVCAFRSDACGNDGSSGYPACWILPGNELNGCVRYPDCLDAPVPCQPYTGFGATVYCTQNSYGDGLCYASANVGHTAVDTRNL